MPTSAPCRLSVVGSWMEKKTFSRSLVRKHLRVEGDLDCFGVTGITVADLGVGGVGDLPARIARFDRYHAFQFIEDRFEAPETASGESGYHIITHKILQ